MGSKLSENHTREWNDDPNAPELWDALKLIKSHSSEGIAALTQLAEAGSGLAMMYLGDVYLRGKYGAPQDLDIGEHWLKRSAEMGSIEGAYGFAWYLRNSGKYDAAIAEYERLSDLKFSPASLALGLMYYRGLETEMDIDKALVYFRKSEKEGNLLAAKQISSIAMQFRMGPVSWCRGILKKIILFFPFIILATNFPNSDRLRGS